MFPTIIKYITNGGVIASVIGSVSAFRSDNFDLGLGLLVVTPVVALAPRFLYKKYFQRDFGLLFLAEIEALVLAFLFLSIFGELVFYQNIPAFDSLVHFAAGIIITILLVAMLSERWQSGRLKPVTAVILGGFIPAILNEIYEAGADALFGSQLWGDSAWPDFKPLWTDTILDIILQTFGAALAVIIIKQYFPLWLERWRRQEQPPLDSPHSRQV